MIPKSIAFQYLLKAKRQGDTLVWDLPDEELDKLFLKLPWREVLKRYHSRGRFYWGFSISGHGEEVFPIMDVKVETEKPSLTAPVFSLEMAVQPTKLNSEERTLLEELLESYLKDPNFKLWWDNDPRGPRKRPDKIKKRMLDAVKQMPKYAGEDDLQLEDVKVSVPEALKFFGFDKTTKPRQVKKEFRAKLKSLQLKHHPDTETGSEEKFLYLQKCRSVLEKWTKR